MVTVIATVMVMVTVTVLDSVTGLVHGEHEGHRVSDKVGAAFIIFRIAAAVSVF
jgi:hypothetical protein